MNKTFAGTFHYIFHSLSVHVRCTLGVVGGTLWCTLYLSSRYACPFQFKTEYLLLWLFYQRNARKQQKINNNVIEMITFSLVPLFFSVVTTLDVQFNLYYYFCCTNGRHSRCSLSFSFSLCWTRSARTAIFAHTILCCCIRNRSVDVRAH